MYLLIHREILRHTFHSIKTELVSSTLCRRYLRYSPWAILVHGVLQRVLSTNVALGYFLQEESHERLARHSSRLDTVFWFDGGELVRQALRFIPAESTQDPAIFAKHISRVA